MRPYLRWGGGRILKFDSRDLHGNLKEYHDALSEKARMEDSLRQAGLDNIVKV